MKLLVLIVHGSWTVWHLRHFLKRKRIVTIQSAVELGESHSVFSAWFDKTLLPQEVFQQKFFEIRRKNQGNDSVHMKEALS